MEPFESNVKIIPGLGIQWTGRDGIDYYVDLLDHDVRRVDDDGDGVAFEGVETIGAFRWNRVGLPEKA